MGAAIIVFLIIGLIVIGILLAPVLTKSRRNRFKARPFPPLWKAVIENNLPIYPYLSPAERRRLQGHIQVFLAEKQFIGCNGLQLRLPRLEVGRFFNPTSSSRLSDEAYNILALRCFQGRLL